MHVGPATPTIHVVVGSVAVPVDAVAVAVGAVVAL